MKKKILNIIIPIIISITSGYVLGSLVYRIYADKTESIFNEGRVYLLQTGAYSSKESMRKNASTTEYMYYSENGLYKTIIALTKDKKNIDKIKEVYGVDVIINEYYLKDSEINNKINYYDKILKDEIDNTKIKNTIGEMLKLYQNGEIKLTKDY